MSKLHVKVIQRNGVDIFVTSSMRMKRSKAELKHLINSMNFDIRSIVGGAGAQADEVKKPVITCRNGEEVFTFTSTLGYKYFNYA